MTQVFDVAPRLAGKQPSFGDRLRQWGMEKAMNWAFDTRLDPTAHAGVLGYPLADRLGDLWPEGEILRGDERLSLYRAISRQRFTGTHHPTAIFVAAGGPIAAIPERGSLSVLDMAPLIAHLAGRAVPEDLEGQVPVEWLTAAHREAHPVNRVQGEALPGLRVVDPSAAEVEDRCWSRSCARSATSTNPPPLVELADDISPRRARLVVRIPARFCVVRRRTG